MEKSTENEKAVQKEKALVRNYAFFSNSAECNCNYFAFALEKISNFLGGNCFPIFTFEKFFKNFKINIDK